MTAVTFRPADPADAGRMADVLCASIIRLCGADHGDDEARIANWLANKTPADMAALAGEGGVIVAERGGTIVAVGAVGDFDAAAGTGKITLNYVHPDHRFRGISAGLLDRLEAELVARGATTGILTSTATARGFYAARGWQAAGPGRQGRWIVGYPMRKRLVSGVPRRDMEH